ncbi:Crp/Fnr family transcriptional regulator [Prevotella copri]|uniref:Crp/Fnr family transcriptional regulator n=1 Tax=Segatella copri TaxID=165179 RepID=A0AA90VH74_9BACT|nr:Crp/Fnr family transcriptional regulator [Segatella copri]MQO10167.1 Crp/Fnr family transcriptional regulator [Segatella copri]
MKESIFVTLQKCTVFEGFTPEEIRETLSTVSYRMVELAARETYVLAGMPCRYADIIVEGEMIARMSGLSGKQAQIERLGESMLIAPAYIFAHNNEMPVSVETSRKTTLLRMRPSELKLLIDTDERIRWNFIQHLSRIDIFLSQKMRMLSLFSVKEKVAQYLIKMAIEQQSRTIHLDVSRQEMADIFGIQKFSLLRCLSEFEEKGAIRIEGKTITILNSDEMK